MLKPKKLKTPPKRKSVVFVRVTEANKLWVEEQAKALGVSESVFLNALIDRERSA